MSTGTRFAPVSANNHSGSIWITTILCMVYSVITIATRAFLRRKIHGTDDYLILGAMVLHIGEAVAIIIGLKHGLGQTISLLGPKSLATSSKSAFAAQQLFIASSCLAKCSTAWLMMRLFNLNGPKSQNHGRSKLFFYACLGMIGIVAAWGVGSMIGLGADCSAASFIRTPALAQCSGQYLRWQIITAIDIATEGLLVIMTVAIVAPVHLSLDLKCQVVLAFMFRVPLVALAVLRLHYIDKYRDSSNPGLAQEPILVIQQVYLCWSIISATIPNLKSFVRSFGSGFGIGLDMERYTQAYGSKGSYGRQYELGSVRNTKSGASRNTTRQDNRSYNDIENQEVVMDARSNGAPVTPHAQEDGSIESAGSQERIIRKDVQWRIHYENDQTRPR